MKAKTAYLYAISVASILIACIQNGQARNQAAATAAEFTPVQSLALSDFISPQPTWQRRDFPVLPPPRRGFALTFNPLNKIALIFGGGGNTDSLETNDFWLTNGLQWMEFQTPHKPEARVFASMGYDAARQSAVLFGGAQSQPFTYLDDTWLFYGVDWIEQHPQTSPSPRAGASLAYDPVRMLAYLFGGYYSVEKDHQTLGDMWAWDGVNWQQLAPATLPSARSEALMIFDPARQNMVLFGGNAVAAPLQDTWIWDGINWVEQHPLHHPPDYYFSGSGMTYDESRQQVILFGIHFDFPGVGEHPETWAWDGQDWTEIQTYQAPPMEVAYGAGLFYLPDLRSVMLFNGYFKKTDEPITIIERSEVWTLDYKYLIFLPGINQ